MGETEERLMPIPEEWCKTVSRILRNDPQLIYTTQESDNYWSATFPDSWDFHRFGALASALDVPGIKGRHIVDMTPECDAYEFWFSFRERKLIGKIGLFPDGKVIMIFSSHIPYKGDKL